VAFDEGLAERIRTFIGDDPGVGERRMMGGLVFMFQGNMACGIVGDELWVRVGQDGLDDALAQPHTRVMDFTGRPSKNMVYVAVDGFAEDGDLRAWIDRGLGFAGSLPAK
jgi:TfoX/Sxy family transcriptional regulator of competence genes